MSPLLTLHHLRKSFGERQLFDIDLLNIAAGTAYVLTGLNGAGKSTLLRVLGGLESAEAEAAAFAGEAVRFSPYPQAMRESVIYVHQHPVMFSTSVAANIAYGLVARGVPRQRIDALVDDAMAWAGVAHLRDSRTQTLSGGEKQRIALARAKVLQPRLLLLDEPTSNLDGAAREQVLALIPSLTASGASVIMACHDRDLIALRGVHRLKLSGGRIQVRAQRSRVA
ncbi:tungstate transport system ATP-binding protein [Noviherbaspirillum humi]|uniref:Tungstate transport system ATP-binding protein n=1 Tax=Noviherbaspirillum humi TaxID=1688639 RepID=A0A239BTW3_9BURK|nr:energy-coupling factor ABC transporter ATP-binding protein [Noviherbaspirillum humi]SNS10603.1 tungstate transport system ATP-binding protein [Noviherbaspirillum humi]